MIEKPGQPGGRILLMILNNNLCFGSHGSMPDTRYHYLPIHFLKSKTFFRLTSVLFRNVFSIVPKFYAGFFNHHAPHTVFPWFCYLQKGATLQAAPVPWKITSSGTNESLLFLLWQWVQ
jgi:hypothetical protein